MAFTLLNDLIEIQIESAFDLPLSIWQFITFGRNTLKKHLYMYIGNRTMKNACICQWKLFMNYIRPLTFEFDFERSHDITRTRDLLQNFTQIKLQLQSGCRIIDFSWNQWIIKNINKTNIIWIIFLLNI